VPMNDDEEASAQAEERVKEWASGLDIYEMLNSLDDALGLGGGKKGRVSALGYPLPVMRGQTSDEELGGAWNAAANALQSDRVEKMGPAKKALAVAVFHALDDAYKAEMGDDETGSEGEVDMD